MTHQIEVSVDHEACYGAQNCAIAAPGVFDYDDDGKAVVRDASAAGPDQIAAAEAGCPAMAIRVSAGVRKPV
jgi:ferredoxin